MPGMALLTPLPQELFTLAVKRAGYLKSSDLRAAGVTASRVPRLIANGDLTRDIRGLFTVMASAGECRARVGPEQYQRLRAAYGGVLAAGPTAAAAGQSALVIMGAQGLPIHHKSEITLKNGGPSSYDNIFYNRRESYTEAYLKNGVRIVSPRLALAQAVTNLPRNNAVAVMESVVLKKLMDIEGLGAVRKMMHGRHGGSKALAWWNLVDIRAESTAETFARLNCMDNGFPPDAVQLEVFDAQGFFVARVDLAWRLPDGRWLLGEIDGFDYHSDRDALRKDRHRQNQLISQQTLLKRWSGTDAMNNRLATDVRAILKNVNWRPGQVSAADSQRICL